MYSSSSEALAIHKKHCNKGKLTKHQTLALGSVKFNGKTHLPSATILKVTSVQNNGKQRT